MYARNVDERYDNRRIVPPDNYSGNAFPDRPSTEFCVAKEERPLPQPPPTECECDKNEIRPPQPPNFPEENCAECLKRADDRCHEPRGEKKHDDCQKKVKGGLLGKLFGGGKGIDIEQIIIIVLIIFFIFSKKDEEKDECDDDKDDNTDLIIILGLILLLS